MLVDGVGVVEAYVEVLEGQEDERAGHDMVGVYNRIEASDSSDVDVRGVWQAVGDIGHFLYFFSSKTRWVVSNRESMEADNARRVSWSYTALPPLLIRSLSNRAPAMVQPLLIYPSCECGCAALWRAKHAAFPFSSRNEAPFQPSSFI
jgi:hypothetical protein